MQMQSLKYVKNVNVQKATYKLNDEIGNKIDLIVDYENNSFQMIKSINKQNKHFINEAENFAKGLLARKHGVNLATRDQFL